MRLLLYGKNAKNIEPPAKKLGLPAGRQGFEIVTANPDVIVSYGGDGTLLSSERKYPGIPKLPIRDSSAYKKCPDHQEETLLKNLLEKKLQIKEYGKLETTIFYQTFTALNDFVIRNFSPIHTIRFRISPFQDKLFIGDGTVISTPFGSTGYFKSITGQTFDKGWGLAFNNTTEKIPPLFLNDEDTVAFKLVRGKATLSFDNNPDIFNVDEESELQFKLSGKNAKIYAAESLRCPNCQIQINRSH